MKTAMLVLLMMFDLPSSSSSEVVGSHPLLSLVETGEQVNVTCTSGGWSREPTLTWRDKGGRELRSSADQYKTDSEGLVSVSSWLLLSPSESEWISCSVGSSDQTREGRVLLFKPATAVLKPGVSPGWRAFTILLVTSLLVSTVMMMIMPTIRGSVCPEDQKDPSEDPETVKIENAAENNTQVAEKIDKATNTEKEIPDWEKMYACKVAIRPDASNTSFLEVGKKKSRVTCMSDVRDKTAFIHALCEERISSGRYYWEITALTEPTKGAAYKCPTSWYVGVTNETAEKKRKVPLTPQNGYWVLHYERETGYYVNDPSQNPVLVRDRFSKLGVFLDCEKRKLSFYDCDKQTHLYTFYDVPSTPLIPVLSPGDKKQHTVMICQEKCVKCDERGAAHKDKELSTESKNKEAINITVKEKQTKKTVTRSAEFKSGLSIGNTKGFPVDLTCNLDWTETSNTTTQDDNITE
ncbi:hypothetical protein SRHO_G00247520 [Serrasalmus rhombeus]